LAIVDTNHDIIQPAGDLSTKTPHQVLCVYRVESILGDEMTTSLEITEYYELVALYRALRVVKFAPQPIVPELTGSPYLADISRRIVDTLSKMEVERGKPERSSDWQIEIDPNGEIWQIAVRNAATTPDFWSKQTHEKKIELARIHLSPFALTDALLEDFVRQVNELASTSG
jgi:hypothetical protein